MKQEEKEFLLKDLCVRLHYGVFLKIGEYSDYTLQGIVPSNANKPLVVRCNGSDFECNIEIVKPYLRPMSSMTEEEKKDILQSLNINGDIDNEGNLLLGVGCDIITLKVCKKYLGELNKRMFDVCHMIEKGLALEAPEGMYK